MFVRAHRRRPRRHRRAGRARRRQPAPDGRAQPLARRAGPPAGAHLPGRRLRRACSTRSGSTSSIVTTVDATHDEYIVAALEAGRDVITEKPMTVDAAALPAHPRRGRARPAGAVAVTFNYRYNPVHEAVRRLLAARRDRRDRLGALRVAARRAARRRLLPPLAPRQGQLRRPAGAQGRATTSTWSTGGSARRPVEVYAAGPAVLLRPRPARRHGYARDYDRGARRARGRGRPVRAATWPTTRGCASSTSTPRPTTATTATATSSPPA